MFILTVDIGNTRISAAVFDGDRLISRLDAVRFEDIERFSRQYMPLDVCAVSRVSRQAPEMEQKLSAGLSCPVFELNAASVPFVIHYDNPEKLGADRMANVFASRQYAPQGAIVVDLGTATHFDIIDSEGAFYGGPILPGLETLHQALSMRIPHLPQNPLHGGACVISANTVEAMNAGSILGTAGAIERIIRNIRSLMGGHLATIVTGGSVPMISSCMDFDFIVPNLTLEGLKSYGAYSLRKMRAKFSA